MANFLRRFLKPDADIPILVPCFNAVSYARGMTRQLQDRGLRNITLLDNASTYPPMVEFLTAPGADVAVVRHGANKGPRTAFLDPRFYGKLPRLFCVTDPDLVLGASLPTDFLAQLVALTETRKIGKVGLALDISTPDIMRDEDFLIDDKRYKIWEWETQFWQDRVEDTPAGDPVFRAPVDTTFAVYNKRYFDPADHMKALRVAGRFTCRHLPWYKDVGMTTEEEAFYRRAATTSYYLRDDGAKAVDY